MKKLIQKQLGELLIESKMITQANLDQALEVQREKGGLVGKILVMLGHTTEQAIAKALTVQYGFPFLPLESYEIDVEVARIIPLQLAKQYELIAVDRVGGMLTVAMSNPLNQHAVEEVEKLTRLTVHACISTTTDIMEAIGRLYPA